MRRYKIAAILLSVLILLLLVMTRFGFSSRSDAVTVKLGFDASKSTRARAIDEALIDALERGYFGSELRQRLDHTRQTVHIDPLWVDTCEVQQGDFERFTAWQKQQGVSGAGALYSSSSNHRIAGLLDSPASGVNYVTAEAYCKQAGGRLPWAEEWEAIAAGRSGRLYPWGDTFDNASWPYQDSYRNASQLCATHPEAATPEGVHDLAGNVMEWSRGSRDSDAFKHRPGAHGAPPIRSHGRELYALSAAWLEIEAGTRSHHLGFRCVYDQPPTKSLWKAPVRVAIIPAGQYPIGVPSDLQLARVALLLPKEQHLEMRKLIEPQQTPLLKVDRCEVSRAKYQSFLNHPLVRLGLFANENESLGVDYTPDNWELQLIQPDLPVTGINWWAADAFARWAGGRLPRVEEWQLIAAGADANPYPWGDDYQSGIAATGDQPEPGAKQCGGTGDRTAQDVRNLGGNVSEWTLSISADQGGYSAWVQGGNWLLPGENTARSVFGRLVPISHRSESIGFRVVYD